MNTAAARLLSQHIATLQRRPDFLIGNLWLPNPDPILKKMGRDIEAYRELRSDAHTGGCIRRRKAAVKAMEWRIERGKASARMHKLVQGIFERIDLDSLINEIMEAVLYGYQPLEIIWRPSPGRAPELVEIIGKPPEWFLFDSEARLRFKSHRVEAWDGGQGELLPDRKFLLARQEATYANPYGFADLSMCFWPVTFKRGGLRFWYKFAEKYGMPWAVGKQPRNSPKAETNDLLEQLEAMIEDAVAVIPDDASVEMIQATNSNGNASAYENLLMFCRSEVAIALLGQNQSTEADSTHASAMAGLGVTYELRDGDAGLVSSVLNNQLIRWIVDLHEGEGAPAPVFELYEEEQVSKAQAERDEILKRTGVRFSKEYYKRIYGFEDGDFEVGERQTSAGTQAQAPQTPAAMAAQAQAQAKGAAFSEAKADPVAVMHDALDQAIAAATQDWQPVMQPMLQPLLDALADAKAQGLSAQELLELLPALLARMDAGPLNERLDTLTLTAYASGLAADPHAGQGGQA